MSVICCSEDLYSLSMHWQGMEQLLREAHSGNSQEDSVNSDESSKDPNSDASSPEIKPSTPTGSSQSSLNEETHLSLKVLEIQLKESSRPIAGTQEAPSLSKGLCSSDITNDELQVSIPSMKDEFQAQLAMALGICNTHSLDGEVTKTQVAKKLSLAISISDEQAEAFAFQYWAENVINYDSKVPDGFYDIYMIGCDSHVSGKDLQGRPATDNVTYEVIFVNRGTDVKLLELEERAVQLAVEYQLEKPCLIKNGLAKKIAALIADRLGGPVESNLNLLTLWIKSNKELRSLVGSNIVPLGCLKFGLVRHRALLFKILADRVGIPCRLLKGKHYTGAEEGAFNLIKDDDESEYVIDLMRAPGATTPADGFGKSVFSEGISREVLSTEENIDYLHSAPSTVREGRALVPKDTEVQSSSSAGEILISIPAQNIAQNQVPAMPQDGPTCLKLVDLKVDKLAANGDEDVNKRVLRSTNPCDDATANAQISELRLGGRVKSEPAELEELPVIPARSSAAHFRHSHSHLRSPSWTEGIGSPAVRELRAKDISLCMLDAAKENPELAQRLQNVLLESGVVAPAELFSDVSPKQLPAQVKVGRSTKVKPGNVKKKNSDQLPQGRNKGKPPQALIKNSSPVSEEASQDRLCKLQSVEGLGERRPLEPSPAASTAFSPSFAPAAAAAAASSPTSAATASILAAVQESLPPDLLKHAPVAAASAITAAVVASSMVVAAVKSEIGQDPDLGVPITAAATATAAIVAATSAAVGLKIGSNENKKSSLFDHEDSENNMDGEANRDGEISKASSCGNNTPECSNNSDVASGEPHFDQPRPRPRDYTEILHDDIAEFDIVWEEVIIGDRIGIGSYGEVYRGEWHGTEVAVKKFLDQDIFGDALEEFQSEVQLMKRMRHPNVVLFMGAVTRVPNLSIVTEFLPRGSLYRLMHRSSNLLDERRRLRMALDVAKGMNYLHTCTPMIVHRDLKSPNLLVDKNWVVKVCDFGLSRMKHHTFLSSKSSAGTPEWMAPEVLRNEPSNEKADVYSFGVILWELATLQQPWNGLNSMQVVGAVGFQNRRLDIPEGMDPNVAKIIQDCFHNDSQGRPSFAQIMSSLKPLQRPLTAPQLHPNKPGIIGPPSQVKPRPLPDN